MVAAGEGLRVGQKQQSDNFGKDLMIVFAGRTSMQVGGARAGRKVTGGRPRSAVIRPEAPACEYVLPELDAEVPIRSANNSASLRSQVLPAVSGDPEYHGWRRTFLHWEDHRQRRRVAVLGSDAKQLFAGRQAVGENNPHRRFPVPVVGVMAFKEQDSSYDGRDVNKVFVPFTAVLRDFPNKPPCRPNTIDQMLATPKSLDQHEECKTADSRARWHASTISIRMTKRQCRSGTRSRTCKRFNAHDRRNEVLPRRGRIVTLFLGGIGVMNVMLVAVRERTREIGVRKAVGATRQSILLQFFVGDGDDRILQRRSGMAVAYGFCAAGQPAAKMPPFFAGLLPAPENTLLSIACWAWSRLVPAMYPASRAASVDPIEALRFEAGG